MIKNYKKDILEFIKKNPEQPVPRVRVLAKRFGIKSTDYPEFRTAYKTLKSSGELYPHSKKTGPHTSVSVITGTFQSHPKGFGFVSCEQFQDGLFIPPDATGDAITGDLVTVRVVKRGKRDGKMAYAGHVIFIKEKTNSVIVGTLKKQNNTLLLLPDINQYTPPIPIPQTTQNLSAIGQKVAIQFLEKPIVKDETQPSALKQTGEKSAKSTQSQVPQITRVLGTPGLISTEIAAITLLFNLTEGFSDAAKQEVKAVQKAFNPSLTEDRIDLTKQTVITIDPKTAKDFDDAISIQRNDDGTYTLGVHIADVAHFVPPNSALDKDARQKGQSTYFPGTVVKMLPEELSNDICSLKENVIRFTQSAFITYSKRGERKNSSVARTFIKSAKRLTYKKAQAILDGYTNGYPPEVVQTLELMNTLAKKIEKQRIRHGMLNLELAEVQLNIGSDEKLADVSPPDDSYTHKIIELFMVEANEVIAEKLTSQNTPFIRRIHPPPSDSAFEELRKTINIFGLDLREKPTKKDLQKLIEQSKKTDNTFAINTSILRAMQKAVYACHPEGHFALGSKTYCHFTSPIRRYADLTVHRSITQMILNKDTGKDKNKLNQEAKQHLVPLSNQLSYLENNGESAERELNKIMILNHLSTQKDSIFQGIITHISDTNIFVQHPTYLIDGAIATTNEFHLTKKYKTAYHEITGKTYGLGDTVTVKIKEVNLPRRKLFLEIQTLGIQT